MTISIGAMKMTKSRMSCKLKLSGDFATHKKNERKCAILNPEPSIKSRIIIFFILVDALYEFERDSSLVLNVLYKFSSTGAKLNCKNDKYRNPSSNYCPLLFIIRSWAASSIAKNN